jgi:phosphoserine phosphatase RsbU/P
MLQSLIREYHSRRMARFAFWAGLCWLLLYIINAVTHAVPVALSVVVWIAVFIALAYYLVRSIRFIRRRLLWRLSRRLAVTYIFIAFIPIVLILVLVMIGAVILNGQFAAVLVRARVQNYLNELQHLSRMVAQEAVHIPAQSPGEMLNNLQHYCQTDLSTYDRSYPNLQITLHVGSRSRAFLLSGKAATHPTSIPAWLNEKGFSGITVDGNRYALRAARLVETSAGRLALVISVPIAPSLLNRAGDGIGPVGLVLHQSRVSGGPAGGDVRVRRAPPEQTIISSDALSIPKAQAWYDFRVGGYSGIHPVEWQASGYQPQRVPIILVVGSRIFLLERQILNALGGLPNFYADVFIGVGIFFLFIELVALIIGILLTRTITSTVNRLQTATEKVKAGDFSYRIGLPPRDQLSALGGAFDSMTASVERLLVESKEKTRLEGELKIAREVQAQLFPRTAPELPGVELYGVCRPARGVSGDYYDFLKLDQDHVGLVLGDVSGKGIFAALLMAGIQSAVRAQFYDGHAPGGLPDSAEISPAVLVARLNRQLYASTSEEKYATFFYAVYDGQSRTLTYTNAGHPAPFLFHHQALLRLESGGTVVGLFPSARYEQAQVRVEPGDVLLAFTDGLTEPENSYSEEFGEKRLIGAVRQDLDSPPETLMDEIYRRITDWTGSAEPQDDMTMLYLKALK